MTPCRPTRTRVHAAATPRVHGILRGEHRDARVLHTGTAAIYLAVDGRCLGLLGRHAARVPCGLLTTATDVAALVGDVRDRHGSVGDGRLVIGDVEVSVERVLDPTVPRLRATPATVEALQAAIPATATTAVRRELPGLDPSPVVDDLLGRGSGLTPLGDDVLAGFLATGVAIGTPATAIAKNVAVRSWRATTVLSATLLECAMHGDVLPEHRRLLQILGSPPPGSHAAGLDAAVAALLAVGHTSGAGLLVGTLAALRRAASRKDPRS